ncbi:FKBP-type peptidyl-prolyl cis-trans isomerase [Flavobacterium sp. ZB4P13]|uniref:FKBP-type peptidyl-prolyl cis-trans isomerase n=1 Tax=Flavobacterium sp. ZB4P13 TaxID=3401728 RepID=UPI003AB02AD1
MKNTLLIALTLIANFVSAQTQLSDYYDASSANRPEFSYNITVRIQKNEGATTDAKRYTATLVQASPDSKGYYNANRDNKFYTCSQLGNICNPNNFHRISVKIFYNCNGQQKVTSMSFSNLNDQQFVSVVLGAGGKFCESIDFNSMEATGAVLNPMHLGQIIDKINQIGTTTTTQNNSNNNNLTTQTVTTKTSNQTENTTAKPLDNYDPNTGLYTNPMANNTSTGSSEVDNFNKGSQQAQQIVDVATGIVDLFAPTPAQLQRRAATTAEYERKKKIEDDIKWENKKIEDGERFRVLYLPLMNEAINGDENTRMILYYSSYHLLSTQLVPQRKAWFDNAYKNDNLDAVLEMSAKLVADGKDGMPLIERAASLGSADAMLKLARWYDSKSFSYQGINIKGGGNAKLAIEWYTKAAELGSPNAMYYLGMIYKYGCSEKKYNTHWEKHKIGTNEKIAFEWFTKSIVPNYKISLYYFWNKSGFKDYTSIGSYFEKESYLELAIIYKKGEVIAKNKAKAEEFENSYKNFVPEPEYANKAEDAKAQKLAYLARIRATSIKSDSGLEYSIIQKGFGGKPVEGTTVYVQYSGYLEDGSLFDSTYEEVIKTYGKFDQDRASQNGYQPFPFQYGKKDGLILGFLEGLNKMSFGDKVVLFIPSKLGYGEGGTGSVIPPNANIIFEVELLETLPVVAPKQ